MDQSIRESKESQDINFPTMDDQFKDKLGATLGYLNSSLNSLTNIKGENATIQKYILLAKENLEEIVSHQSNGESKPDDISSDQATAQQANGSNFKIFREKNESSANSRSPSIESRQLKDATTTPGKEEERSQDLNGAQRKILGRLENPHIWIRVQPGSGKVLINRHKRVVNSKDGADGQVATHQAGVGQDLLAIVRGVQREESSTKSANSMTEDQPSTDGQVTTDAENFGTKDVSSLKAGAHQNGVGRNLLSIKRDVLREEGSKRSANSMIEDQPSSDGRITANAENSSTKDVSSHKAGARQTGVGRDSNEIRRDIQKSQTSSKIGLKKVAEFLAEDPPKAPKDNKEPKWTLGANGWMRGGPDRNISETQADPEEKTEIQLSGVETRSDGGRMKGRHNLPTESQPRDPLRLNNRGQVNTNGGDGLLRFQPNKEKLNGTERGNSWFKKLTSKFTKKKPQGPTRAAEQVPESDLNFLKKTIMECSDFSIDGNILTAKVSPAFWEDWKKKDQLEALQAFHGQLQAQRLHRSLTEEIQEGGFLSIEGDLLMVEPRDQDPTGGRI